MSDEERRTDKTIRAPESDLKREITRAAVEGVASLVPGGSALARLYQVTHPSNAKTDQGEWQQAISERTNEHTERLDQHDDVLAPKQTITGTAAELAIALARDCPDGLGRKRYELADLCKLLPDAEAQAIEDAVFDLKSFALIELQPRLGPDISIGLALGSYLQLDHQVMGWNTVDDAHEVAALMLEHNEGRAAMVHERSRWHRRRFNPAFDFVLGLLPVEHVSEERQPHYPAASVLLLREDKAILRRFVGRASGSRE
jgi:hypothetical protein